MGQRHQVWLIARVRPAHGAPTYRCVGGFHDQLCCGTLPLRGLYRFVELLRQEVNAAVVRGELGDLDDKYDRTTNLPSLPCPYTMFLLALAWSVSVEHPYYSSSAKFEENILDANLGCWDIMNDDGLTVVDISYPLQPAYCFVHNNKSPLSAYEYLERYYDLCNIAYDVRSPDRIGFAAWLFLCIGRLAGTPIIPACALRETWSGAEFSDRNCAAGYALPGAIIVPPDLPIASPDYPLYEVILRYILKDEEQHCDATNTVVCAERVQQVLNDVRASSYYAELGKYERFQKHLSSLLGDRALYEFVTEIRTTSLELFHTGAADGTSHARDQELHEFPGDLPHGIHLSATDPGRIEQTSGISWTIHHLRNLSPFPEHYVELLIRTVTRSEDVTLLDLSGYQLRAEQVIRVVSAVATCPSLDLSGNQELSADDVADILESSPSVLRLIVMQCPSLDSDLVDVVRQRPLAFRRVEGILHPSFLSLSKSTNFPISFTFSTNAHSNKWQGLSLPFFTPDLVLQALRTLLPLAWRERFYNPPREEQKIFGSFTTASVENMELLANDAFTAGHIRPPGERWRRRAVVSVPRSGIVLDQLIGTWVFLMDWPQIDWQTALLMAAFQQADDPKVFGEDVRRWGFIRYAPNFRPVTDASGVNWRHGEIYDLRGFLRCMAEEGRPCPDEKLVQSIEEMLDARYQPDGTPVCPIMDPEVVPFISTTRYSRTIVASSRTSRWDPSITMSDLTFSDSSAFKTPMRIRTQYL